MASITLKDLPPDLHETLRGEAEANHRSMAGEIMARLQRSLDTDRATRRDQAWINAALESGPEEPFSRGKFDAAVEQGLARAQRKAA
jgi:plasmid stability protein